MVSQDLVMKMGLVVNEDMSKTLEAVDGGNGRPTAHRNRARTVETVRTRRPYGPDVRTTLFGLCSGMFGPVQMCAEVQFTHSKA